VNEAEKFAGEPFLKGIESNACFKKKQMQLVILLVLID